MPRASAEHVRARVPKAKSSKKDMTATGSFVVTSELTLPEKLLEHAKRNKWVGHWRIETH